MENKILYDKIFHYFKNRIEPKDYDFYVMTCMLCKEYGLAEELVKFIEDNNVTEQSKIYDWLFGEENGHIEYVDEDEEDEKRFSFLSEKLR